MDFHRKTLRALNHPWAARTVDGGEAHVARVAIALPPEEPGHLVAAGARKVSGWPRHRALAHAYLCEYGYTRLTLAQLLGQLGIFLTWWTASPGRRSRGSRGPRWRGLCRCPSSSCVDYNFWKQIILFT
jgi:hypothetical protein